MAQQQEVGTGGSGATRDTEAREARAAAMWPADRAERARLWDEAMARGVAAFWSQHAADHTRVGGAQ